MTTKGKIVVTGGTGYIGSHTTVELIQQGYEVLIIDNLSNSEAFIVDRIEQISGVRPSFFEFDLLDQEKMDAFFNQNKDIQGVIHFAAAKAVGESVQIPLHYYRNNLVTMINLLEAMKKHQVVNFVFSSSCTVYGQPDQLPVTENAPVKPAESPYGYTKQVNEAILNDTIKSGANIKGIALRYFNPIGAHHSGLIGELPRGVPNNLMPFITQTAYGIREQLRVFGSDYSTPDGSCIRDYIHVVDLAKAHIVAIERLIKGTNKSNYEMFNIGTGNGFSVFEVIQSFERSTGKKLNYKVVDRRPGDIEQIWADTTIGNKELGWKAEKTLDEMTLSAWQWELNYRNK
ncbi:MAG TPA: UDP-glucose 4-epimerase GalE [Marinilabiliales bacterium]|jgi:UDP-glucose 4-epimerase|nr:MAG: UDP-glucose 4-epimerase GalE [Bacteroidetes bacterium GWA2_40_14]OFX60861.1 MAG: UDP-glucose 4-epimerase GalE [Bacteroidetes bacterium GWC2_40_13]OFX71515.1 MAG: UDP-glucose 4-epimerase GalE [Bacteroidetes bacterium GWD2_40_43]OFX95549.1 MAG: UDP-glucose 4-epimerase GalE [Bacteroidetes bacterium GWE2_40_63]OFY22293.1 MAG: UDP-glucose 4-epimerase GalE [Bacteroidetes bacterium GWF2_40_13]OFZ24929.1 MAG: UDP-glucose 4-epimerase GalE [Bacteroidetes bacterium RIFOXYC2_FULL_40_12]HAM99991.1